MTKRRASRPLEPPVLTIPILGISADQLASVGITIPPDPSDPSDPSDLEVSRIIAAQSPPSLAPAPPSPTSYLPFPTLPDLVARVQQSLLDYQATRITWADVQADVMALLRYLLPRPLDEQRQQQEDPEVATQ